VLLRAAQVLLITVWLPIISRHVAWFGHILRQTNETPLAQQTRPQLDSDDAKDEKDKEAQEQNVAQHWKCVQQKSDQNAHTWNPVDRPEWPKDSHRSNCSEIHLAHVQNILEATCQNNETVQPVPIVAQVRLRAARHAHGHHFDQHLHEKEDKYHMVEHFKPLATV